jgi:hypothetical protein
LHASVCSTHTLSKRTLSVKTSSTLRFLAGLAESAGSWGTRRTGSFAPAPLPTKTSTSAEANATAVHADRTRAKRVGAGRMTTEGAAGEV